MVVHTNGIGDIVTTACSYCDGVPYLCEMRYGYQVRSFHGRPATHCGCRPGGGTRSSPGEWRSPPNARLPKSPCSLSLVLVLLCQLGELRTGGGAAKCQCGGNDEVGCQRQNGLRANTNQCEYTQRDSGDAGYDVEPRSGETISDSHIIQTMVWQMAGWERRD